MSDPIRVKDVLTWPPERRVSSYTGTTWPSLDPALFCSAGRRENSFVVEVRLGGLSVDGTSELRIPTLGDRCQITLNSMAGETVSDVGQAIVALRSNEARMSGDGEQKGRRNEEDEEGSDVEEDWNDAERPPRTLRTVSAQLADGRKIVAKHLSGEEGWWEVESSGTMKKVKGQVISWRVWLEDSTK